MWCGWAAVCVEGEKRMTILGLVITVEDLALGLLIAISLRLRFQNQFYGGYFNQRQRNLGKDPERVLAKELGWLRWIF